MRCGHRGDPPSSSLDPVLEGSLGGSLTSRHHAAQRRGLPTPSPRTQPGTIRSGRDFSQGATSATATRPELIGSLEPTACRPATSQNTLIGTSPRLHPPAWAGRAEVPRVARCPETLPCPESRGGLGRTPSIRETHHVQVKPSPLARIVSLRPSRDRRSGMTSRSGDARSRSTTTVDSAET